MTSTEQKIYDIIRRKKNTRAQYISRLLGMSSGYVDLVCRGLSRRGHINFTRGLAAIPVSVDFSSDLPAQPHVEEAATQAEPVSSESKSVLPILSFEGISSELVKALEGAGCATVGNLAETPISKLMSAGGLNVKQAADLINKARGELGMLH